MNNHNTKRYKFRIHGMHCASCEVMVEEKFKNIPGVEKVQVNHASGKAKIFCTCEPSLPELQAAIKESGYGVTHWHERQAPGETATDKNSKRDYFEICAIFLLLTGAYLLLREFNLLPKGPAISENMGYGVVFLIGLVAAMSTCIAVTGGLLVATAAKYNEKYPQLTGLQKFKPHIYFNFGRIISYTVLGGAVGALGSLITFSPRANGILTIIVSIVMIMLGFQLLKIFPWLKHFYPRMPKFLAHKIHDMSGQPKKSTPFMLGAATFFLPCGFTLALQLYVLASGNILTGALTMLIFALGTLPALLSLGVISSFAKGTFQRYFLKFSGILVITLGFFNINNGMALTGFSDILQSQNTETTQTFDPNVQIVDGKQVVKMTVSGLDYYPHQFTVMEDTPVEWQIDGSDAVGCAQVISVPKLGVVEYLSPTEVTKISFTPDEPGRISFSCTMGMTTRGSAFTVVSKDTKADTAPATAPDSPSSDYCDPTITNCI